MRVEGDTPGNLPRGDRLYSQADPPILLINKDAFGPVVSRFPGVFFARIHWEAQTHEKRLSHPVFVPDEYNVRLNVIASNR